ncbi:MAG: ABC transporter ATP-binding protein [Desulfobacteraceae bacterium]
MTGVNSKEILIVDHLSVGISITPSHVVVKDICFSLNEGELLGIVGESGSGKSITACAISALLPPPLTVLKGKVIFKGRNIFLKNPYSPGFQRGKDILVLFQSPLSALDPTMSIGTQIVGALRIKKHCSRNAAKLKAEELLTDVGLSFDHMNAYPFQLSGGQRQRVLMAMAFGLRPQVLIADEPTAGQDEDNRDLILKLLVRLQQEIKTSVIIISHDLRVISQHVQNIVVLYQGKQVESGNVSDIMSHPHHFHTQKLVQAMHYLQAQP